MKTVYLVRHGDYDYRDASPATHGQGLMPTGIQQAEITAYWFSSLPYKVTSVHSSDYLRAKQTAEIIVSHFPDLSVQTWQELRECNDVYYKEQVKPFRPADIAFQRFFQSSESCDQYEVVVCHANLIRYFLSRIQEWSKKEWEESTLGNCSISEVEVRESGNMSARSVERDEHLPEHLRERVENIA